MFASHSPVLQPGARILVTGCTGFVGSHVADQFLKAGYRVRGTTRDAVKNKWIETHFDGKYGPGLFELMTISDMMREGAFAESLEGIAGVVHVAADMSFDPNPNKVIPPMLLTAMNLMKAVAEQSSVKRVVFTSSCAAAASPVPGKWQTITRDSWNDDAITEAWGPPPYTPERGFSVYAASKAQCEREVWRWYHEEKPGFVLNTVLPSMNMGSSLAPAFQGHPSTSGLIEALFKGNVEAVSAAAQYFYVDVQDVARTHLAALLHPDVSSERIFAYAGPYTWKMIQDMLMQMYPETEVIRAVEPAALERSEIEPAGRAEALLKEMGQTAGWTSLVDSLRANTADLV